jgi:enamine deaminase RidA (YjgF/YER057c/UK114 family)
MDRTMSSRHEVRNPETLARPTGFSHAVIAQPGRAIYLAGQTAQLPDGSIDGDSLAEQFDVAAGNVVKALSAADGQPSDLVSLQIFVTDIDEYLRSRPQIGEAYRRHFGTHYPAMALLEVRRLFDPAAKVELMAVAVSPSATSL